MGLGYACINTVLKNKNIFVNRGMIKKSFLSKGLEYVSHIIVLNLKDLLVLLDWNLRNEIFLYRMSSDMFPWMSEYEFDQLPEYENIVMLLEQAGSFARKHKMRLTFHPGPYNVLASENENTIKNTVKDLNQHAKIMDMMKLEPTVYNKINIHIGSTLAGNKEKALQNFINNFSLLDKSVRNRLTVENDDKPSMYTVRELYDAVFAQIKTPIVFDYHHHLCHPGHDSEKDALELALSTWKEINIKPVVHYSEPRSDSQFRAHSDFISKAINLYGNTADIMLEVKQKENALLAYKQSIFVQ